MRAFRLHYLTLSILVSSVVDAWIPVVAFQLPATSQRRYALVHGPIKAPTYLDNFPSSKIQGQLLMNYQQKASHGHLEHLNRTQDRDPQHQQQVTQNKTQTKTRRSWKDSFEQLEKYKVIYGHTRVPHNYQHDPALAQWVKLQRQRHETLSQKHMQMLDEIGFDWKQQSPWDEMYEKLEAYWRKHNTTNVPANYEKDLELAHWVSIQRTKQHKLSNDKREALEALGFDWTKQDANWMTMFHKLEKYAKAHEGDTRVTLKTTTYDAPFVNWVHRQRVEYSKGKLRPDRVDKLNELGFCWSATADVVETEDTSNLNHTSIQSSIDAKNIHDSEQPEQEYVVELAKPGFAQSIPVDTTEVPRMPLIANTSTWMSNAAINKRSTGQVRPEHADEPIGQSLLQSTENADAAESEVDSKTHRVTAAELAELMGFSSPANSESESDDTETIPFRGFYVPPPVVEESPFYVPPPVVEESPWLDGYLKLVDFYHKHGHAEITLDNADPSLVAWANEQRSLYQSGQLKPIRRDMLNRFRFSWHE
ncbi:hypothetical protein MPSEU_000545000 [Mayamaea pseudoterrestris]|nr:hypothetical protein MPSEU_000545000 [Mayamaea pseudoterrestris]